MILRKKKLTIILLIIIFIYWIIWANSAIQLNTYTISSNTLPNSFDGYRIVHLSDIHNKKDNKDLIEILKDTKPDMIAITGDLIDSRNTDINVALDFVKEVIKIAPCYYVTGNHEARISEYNTLKNGLIDLGVIILEDESIELKHHNDSIHLIGVSDPSFTADYLFGDSESVLETHLQNLSKENSYTILLSHRPELFELYTEYDIDLVLSGHAHGGQFRLPFVGGIIAPNQGLFPKYDEGLYTKEKTNMIVSRGIGNSIIPIRINNRPEVILIILEKN